MSSAFRDPKKGGFILDFRPVHGRGTTRRRVRAPREITSISAARALANRLEADCRAIEETPTPARINDALASRAITPDQADDLRAALSGRPAKPRAAATIIEAFDAHPSTRRELLASPRDYTRHRNAAVQFAEFAAGPDLGALTVLDVQRWLDTLRDQGLAWDSRRHALIALRRASAMAPSHGRPDVLRGLRLDKRESHSAPEALTLPQILRAALALTRALTLAPDPSASSALSAFDPSPRALAAVALGGLLGLRPSEIRRARLADLTTPDGDPISPSALSALSAFQIFLHVGARERKNSASRRILPVPGLALEWLAPAIAAAADSGAPPDETALIPSQRRGRGHREFSDTSPFAHWIGPILSEAAGCPATAGHLRAGFATWTNRAGLDERWIEAYLGHAAARLSSVTTRHYLAARDARDLIPAAEAIDNHARAALESITRRR